MASLPPLRATTPNSSGSAAAGIAALAELLREQTASLESRYRDVARAVGGSNAASPVPPAAAERAKMDTLGSLTPPRTAARGSPLLDEPTGGATPGAALRLLAEPVPVVRDMPDGATQKEKMLGVFQELTADGGGVTLPCLSAALGRCRIDLGADTVDAMFRRADLDGDSVLNQTEFLRLGDVYPTLLSCLYHRSRAHWAEVKQQEDISAAKGKLLQLEHEDRREQSDAETAAADIVVREQQLLKQQRQLQEDEAKTRQARQRKESMTDALATARAAARDAGVKHAAAQEQLKQAQNKLRDGERRKEHLQLQNQAQEARVVAAVQRLRELEEMVLEQQREVQAQQLRASRATDEVADGASQVRAAQLYLDDCEADLRLAHEAVGTADARVSDAIESETRASEDVQRAVRQADAARERHAALVRQLDALRVKVNELHSMRNEGATATQRQLKSQEAELEALVRRHEEAQRRQKEEYETEAPVLQLEAQLRRRREELEHDEDRLRSHRRQLDSVRPPRLPPPSPSSKEYPSAQKEAPTISPPRPCSPSRPGGSASSPVLPLFHRVQDPLAELLGYPSAG
eukprot:TRINITY_DN28767_c0_g1_i1.p1 TRINITY_DN28767_c0_g1~~TRINITY_DN28767_c0_g1_i1.p1  ORF type:complete len:577 (+),score=117.30 TRINITY_DN28767_c0_g1_i1:59-1789(+)